MYEVIVSQKKESTLNHWKSLFKTNPKPFHVDINMHIAEQHEHIERPLVGLLVLVWTKMQIHSLPLGAAFGAVQ